MELSFDYLLIKSSNFLKMLEQKHILNFKLEKHYF